MISDGDKFSERKEKYRVLKKVEALMHTLSEDGHCNHGNAEDAIEAGVGSDKPVVKDIVSVHLFSYCLVSTSN